MDLIIRNALTLSGNELRVADIGIRGETIAAIAAALKADGPELDAAGCLVIPGMIAASWMIMLVANAALAQGLLARFGANWRPSPDLAGLDLPLWVPVLCWRWRLRLARLWAGSSIGLPIRPGSWAA